MVVFVVVLLLAAWFTWRVIVPPVVARLEALAVELRPWVAGYLALLLFWFAVFR